MLVFFRIRIQNSNFSNVWKYIYLSMPYVQITVLTFLFFIGISSPE